MLNQVKNYNSINTALIKKSVSSLVEVIKHPVEISDLYYYAKTVKKVVKNQYFDSSNDQILIAELIKKLNNNYNAVNLNNGKRYIMSNNIYVLKQLEVAADHILKILTKEIGENKLMQIVN
jgi:molybdopterin converting factor small subunit